jgi:hypothetical protein
MRHTSFISNQSSRIDRDFISFFECAGGTGFAIRSAMLPFLGRLGRLVLIACTVFMLVGVINFRREYNGRGTESWAPQSKPEIQIYRPQLVERYLPFV